METFRPWFPFHIPLRRAPLFQPSWLIHSLHAPADDDGITSVNNSRPDIQMVLESLITAAIVVTDSLFFIKETSSDLYKVYTAQKLLQNIAVYCLAGGMNKEKII